jgi:alanine racemase
VTPGITDVAAPVSELVIDLRAYRRNLALLCTRITPSQVMAVVKADAYGHGLLPIAKAAVDAGIGWLGALDTDTARELRAAGIDSTTGVFAWHLAPDEDYRAVIDSAIDLGVSTLDQLEGIARSHASTTARVHLKIDTGLHRNGASVQDWPGLVRRALELESDGTIELYGVWTHIAEASYEEDSAAIRRFTNAITAAESLGATFTLRHLAASAAGFERADCRFDLVRFGAFGYGISPGGGVTAAELGLEPVMSLRSKVLATDDGTAVIPLGFGDGISSRATGRVSVLVDGALRLIGELEPDRMIVVGEPVRPGTEAVLFGSGASGEWTLQQWADATGTIGEEIVTRLHELPRRYLGEN